MHSSHDEYFNDEFTDSVQLLTGDLSLVVLAGCDDDFSSSSTMNTKVSGFVTSGLGC